MEYNATNTNLTEVPPHQDPGEGDFGISKIVDCKVDANGQQMYRVEWKPTWEPWENLTTCQHLVNEFWSIVNSAKAKENIARQLQQRMLLQKQGGAMKTEKSYGLTGSTISSINGLIQRSNSNSASVLQDPSTTLMNSFASSTLKLESKTMKEVLSNTNLSNAKLTKGNSSSSSMDDFDNPYVRLAYMCKICGKEQSKKFKFDWKRHYNTHGTVPKPHHCEVCGKDFAQKGLLNKHMKSHNISNNNKNNSINHAAGYGNFPIKEDTKDWHGKVESGSIYLD